MPGAPGGPGAADLAVVIPTRHRWPVLARTLDGLARQRVTGFEVVVVVDGTDQAVPDLPVDRLLVVPHGGPGAARNAGASATDRPLVLFLGDDMVPCPDLVGRHLDRHRRCPEDGGAVLGHVDWHPEVAGSPLAGWLDRTRSQFDFGSIPGDEAGFGHFYSCNLSLKRRFFLDAGGFDPTFTYYYEDLDCGYRLASRGLRLWYERGARAAHLHPYDLAALERRFRAAAQGEHHMAARHPWFEPFFLRRAVAAVSAPPVASWWRRAGPLVPPSAGRLHDLGLRRHDRLVDQRTGRAFLAGWAAAAELAELRGYLGPAYDHQRLVTHQATVDHEREQSADEATFYRTSHGYLYDLTAFAMSDTKAPYLAELRAVLPHGASVLDYGCGIGADGLRLAADGYEVSFADFANPSTAYLRWRLARRGVDRPVYDLDRDEVPGGFDAAFALDVIEHVDDPFDFVEQLERRARLVMVNLLEDEPDDTHLHRPLPIARLLDRAERCGLIRYRRYHGRSHLLLYRSPGPSTRPGRLRSAVERRLGPHRRGRPGWFPLPAVPTPADHSEHAGAGAR